MKRIAPPPTRFASQATALAAKAPVSPGGRVIAPPPTRFASQATALQAKPIASGARPVPKVQRRFVPHNPLSRMLVPPTVASRHPNTASIQRLIDVHDDIKNSDVWSALTKDPDGGTLIDAISKISERTA